MKTGNFLALLYADIFDFPLKKEEMEKWRIIWELGARSCPPARLRQAKRSGELEEKIEERNGFYFLKGRERIIDLRKKREKYSEKKIKIAKKIANLLKIIPTIKMVAVTGALAVKNVDKNDDIDFLIITSAGSIWITRFLTAILVELTGKRRRPGDKKIRNKICLNMFIDENHLVLPEDEKNLYTAHEVVQLIPIWDKGDIYLRFLNENEWVREYLPNVMNKFKIQNSKFKSTVKKSKVIIWLEKIIKNFQLWYMRKRKTTERISDGIIRFHPQDKTKQILEEYDKRLKKYVVSSM